MELGWNDLALDSRAVVAGPADLLAQWQWLVHPLAQPILLTAFGDLFLRYPGGSIAFLDTAAGTCEVIAPSDERWRAMLNDPPQIEAWFHGEIIQQFAEYGVERQQHECFSPYVPHILGGTWELSNFHPVALLDHLTTLGQIHLQLRTAADNSHHPAK